jgi:predicted nucleotidyltransferase
VWSFTTVLATPTLVSPPNGATETPTNCTLLWNAVSGATSYRVQVSTNSTFIPSTVDQSGITITGYGLALLSNSTTYYWRVVATNASNTSLWSSTWSFVTTGGLFTETSISLAGVEYSSVAWGDYDNDGDLDLLITGSNGSSDMTKLYRNDNGTLVDIAAPLSGVSQGSAVWGDFDNDGDLDILLTGSPGISKIYRNDNGLFVDNGAPLVGLYNSSAAWGDFDNDGDLDVILIGSTTSFSATPVTKLYRNDNGSFVEISTSLVPVTNGSVAWGDYDNDGDLDILLTGYTGTSSISKIYRNDGPNPAAGAGWNFADIGGTLTEVYYSSVAWGDYDNDGDLDILIVGKRGLEYVSKVYRNDSGTFFDIGAPLVGIAEGSASWGDYDNDGDLDILLTGSTGSTFVSKVYRNDNGTFVDVSTPLAGVGSSSAAWGDYNNDGKLDIALAGHSVGRVCKIYRNDGATVNTVPTAPTGLGSSVSGSSAVLAWSKATDSQTAQNSLTYNVRLGTTPLGVEGISPMANVMTGYRKVPKIGNTNHRNTWTVKNLLPRTYYWSVQTIDNGFSGSPFAAEQSFSITTSVKQVGNLTPTEYSLSQNFPNPFNPTTNIQFDLPRTSPVLLKIYSALGIEVAILVSQTLPAGTYKVDWDAANLPSGVYFYRLQAGEFVQTRKLVLLK